MSVAMWSVATVGAAWLDANGWAVLLISDAVASGAVANRIAISAASQARLRIRLLEGRAGSIRVQRCRARKSSPIRLANAGALVASVCHVAGARGAA